MKKELVTHQLGNIEVSINMQISYYFLVIPNFCRTRTFKSLSRKIVE